MLNNLGDNQYIGKYIGMIHRASCIYFSKEFSKFGIGSGQYLFLLKLYKNEGITQEELTDQLKLDKATTARAIKKLEDEGYVKRIKKESDKRAYNLMLTQKAKDIKDDFYLIINGWELKVKNCFSNEEAEQLMDLLIKITNTSLFNQEM